MVNGTLSLGDTREQNAQLILVAEKGEFKEWPTLGVGLHKYINSTGRDREMLREVKLQLSLDNITPQSITISDGKLKVEL